MLGLGRVRDLRPGPPRRATRRRSTTPSPPSGPDHLATLIYTSGTTGRPKGVRLVQDGWTYEGAAIEAYDIISPDDLQYLWLPLSHVFGKALIAIQLEIGFTTAVDGTDRQDRGQPRRGQADVHGRRAADLREGPGQGDDRRPVRGQGQDLRLGVRRRPQDDARSGSRGDKPTGLLGVQYALADRLVFSKIKARMGGKIRFFVSGSAALSREVQEWFYAAGLLVLEGYGLTETSAATFVNNPRATRFGTVGPPVPGTEVQIADDGEILVRGAGVMRGYHNIDEATARGAQSDGWFATGDIGELDDARLPADHRPQEGPDQDLRRQVRRAAEGRGRGQGGLPVRQPGGGARRGPQVRQRADHPRSRGDRGLGARSTVRSPATSRAGRDPPTSGI